MNLNDLLISKKRQNFIIKSKGLSQIFRAILFSKIFKVLRVPKCVY